MADAAQDMTRVSREVLDEALALGFALAGISASGASAHGPEIRRWIRAGRHGEMHYLENNLEVRLDPGRLLPGARSIIVVGDAYPRHVSPEDHTAQVSSKADPPDDKRDADPPRGRFARYAWGQDYHKVIKKRLHALSDRLKQRYPDEAFRSTVDTAPILEREHAARAGLGWQAKNTMLIHPRHGSYFLLGAIVTTVELMPMTPAAPRRGNARPPSAPSNAEAETEAPFQPTTRESGERAVASDPVAPGLPIADHCANCTRCIDACPTDAIADRGHHLDATRCVSYLTLEHHSPIATELHAGMGRWLAGCDICQEVCPYNRIADRHPLPINPRYLPGVGDRSADPTGSSDSPDGGDNLGRGLALTEVIRWTAEDRARVFRGSALKRMKLDMIRRNALIAAGNTLLAESPAVGNPDPGRLEALRDAIYCCLDDADPLVRTTAQQVRDRLASSPWALPHKSDCSPPPPAYLSNSRKPTNPRRAGDADGRAFEKPAHGRRSGS